MGNFFRIFFYCCLFYASGITATHAQTIATIAGNGSCCYSGDGGPATLAKLNNPLGIYTDSAGDIYVADNSAHVRKVVPTGIITTIAGTGSFAHSGDGGPATAAGIGYPRDVTMDKRGNIYFSAVDPTNQYIAYIRKIDTSGTITTIAGNGMAGFTGDGGPATAASFRGIRDITIDSGNIYLTDWGDNRIRKIDTSGIISTVAGTGTPAFSGDGGPATAAELYSPLGIAIDDTGNIYFSDNGNSCIRKINTLGVITTIAGIPLSSGCGGDGGPATAAQFSSPNSICLDVAGNLYVADAGCHRVRKIDVSGTINTFAGDGLTGHTGDCGSATAANIGNPAGVSTDRSGNLYFSDAANQYIRKVYAPGTTGITGPNNICTQTPVDFRDSTIDGKWQSSNTAIAGIDSNSGHLTGLSAGSVIITYFFTGCYATDSLTVKPSPSAGAISGIDSICIGDTVHLHDTVSGGIWNSSNSLVTTITSSGTAKGITPGLDTIKYMVTVGGCSSAAMFPFVVRQPSECPNDVPLITAGSGAMNIFPNPSNGLFTVLIVTGTNEAALLVVSNVVGQKIKEITTATNRLTEISLDAPAGIYFLNTITTHGSWSEKVMVTK